MASPLTDLPHGLTEALHYQEPFPWIWWVATMLAVALGAFVWWWLRRRPARAGTGAIPEPETGTAPIGIEAELGRLRRRHLAGESYRDGCHDLSELLRGHLERTRRRPFSRWTAREAERAEGDTVWTRLLSLLSDLQFSRRPPRRSDFEGACDLARDVLAVEGSG